MLKEITQPTYELTYTNSDNNIRKVILSREDITSLAHLFSNTSFDKPSITIYKNCVLQINRGKFGFNAYYIIATLNYVFCLSKLDEAIKLKEEVERENVRIRNC